MKKQAVHLKLGLQKSVVSNLNADQLKGGTIGVESADRLHCETEDCTQNCVTVLYTNCNHCETC